MEGREGGGAGRGVGLRQGAVVFKEFTSKRICDGIYINRVIDHELECEEATRRSHEFSQSVGTMLRSVVAVRGFLSLLTNSGLGAGEGEMRWGTGQTQAARLLEYRAHCPCEIFMHSFQSMVGRCVIRPS